MNVIENKYIVEMSQPGDAGGILAMLEQAPDALLSVSLAEILSWIAAGQSIVAKTDEGAVVAHQGMHYWGESQVVEVRSAFVDPEHRKQGLNTLMKNRMIAIAQELHPDADIVGFTEAASKSRGILQKLGFIEVDLDDVPDELFEICPEDCFKKTGIPCGCKVFYMSEQGEK